VGDAAVGEDRREPLSQDQAVTKDLSGTGWRWRGHSLATAEGQNIVPLLWRRGVVHAEVSFHAERRSCRTSFMPNVVH